VLEQAARRFEQKGNSASLRRVNALATELRSVSSTELIDAGGST
jgi:hypothetical protein